MDGDDVVSYEAARTGLNIFMFPSVDSTGDVTRDRKLSHFNAQRAIQI